MLIACPLNTFGYNCTGTCNCTTKNTSNSTQTCDLVTGFCNCLKGWTGSLCETDVDECATETHDCTTQSNTECNNIDGGFECLCVAGYQKNLQDTCEREYILQLRQYFRKIALSIKWNSDKSAPYSEF